MSYFSQTAQIFLESIDQSKNQKNNSNSNVPPLRDKRYPEIDRKCKSFGFNTGISGQVYYSELITGMEKQVFVFIEKDGDLGWNARRETFVKGNPKAISMKKLSDNVTLEDALKKARNYARYLTKNK